MHLYKNRLTVDLGMAEGLGGGFFTMGDDNMTFGVAIHRGPKEQMIVGWGNRNRERDGQSGFGLALPDEAGIGGAPIERFDGFFGMKLSELRQPRLRLGIGQGLVWARNEVPDGDNVDTLDDSNSQNAFNIRLGATYRSGSLHLDNAAHIVLASGTTVDDNTTNFQASDQTSGSRRAPTSTSVKGSTLGAFAWPEHRQRLEDRQHAGRSDHGRVEPQQRHARGRSSGSRLTTARSSPPTRS